MCGITGFVDFNRTLTQAHLTNACTVLQHRGPDDHGTMLKEASGALVGLGHRRLAILDLSAMGHQPMYSDDKSIAIVLNGEVYNFKEIRKELEEKGHRFFSNSDTEVVIKAYQQYGIKCLEQFNGMFAFVLYDSNKQKVFLVRDRAGVKPLYYSFKNNTLLFASELKALQQYPCFVKEIDKTAVSLYFKYGYIKAPYSIFKDTLKLLPGHFAEMDLPTATLTLHTWWNVLDYYNKPTKIVHEKIALQRMEELFTTAFQYRMISDVPVGVFLSGGYDSSLVTAVLQKNSANQLKTFAIGFREEKYNEAGHAKKVAAHLGTEHHEYFCTAKDAAEIIPSIPYFYDEPFGDSSALPTMLVSRFARKEVTVALSADAGDELFAGYNRYDQLTKLKKLEQKTPGFLRKSTAAILKNLPGGSLRLKRLAEVITANDDADMSDRLSRHFTHREISQLLKNEDAVTLIDKSVMPLNNDFINTLLAADYKTYMADDILAKVDRGTMSAGLEGREPLLDHHIIEWVAQLSSTYKYREGTKKYLLKKMAHQYLPASMMNRPKMGFGIPLHEWLTTDLKEFLFRYINKESIDKHGLINGQYAEQIRDAFIGGKPCYANQVWLILMFQLWWEKWMD